MKRAICLYICDLWPRIIRLYHNEFGNPMPCKSLEIGREGTEAPPVPKSYDDMPLSVNRLCTAPLNTCSISFKIYIISLECHTTRDQLKFWKNIN